MTCQPLWVILCCLPENWEKKDSRGNEREGQGRKRNRNEREEIKKNSPSTLALPKWTPISAGRPGDVRYPTPSPHSTTPLFWVKKIQLWKTKSVLYCNNPKYLDRYAFANSADQTQTLQNAASDQDLYCLPYKQQYFRHISTGGRMDLIKF